jgi:hypothetical protein
MLYNCGYKNTLRICSTYFFSTVAVVTRIRLSVTLYSTYLSCLVIIQKIVVLTELFCDNVVFLFVFLALQPIVFVFFKAR